MLLFQSLTFRRWILPVMLAALVVPAALSQLRAQTGGRAIVIGQSFELPSTVLKSVRRINVYLPDHYGEAGRRFPVLYLLDGGEKEDFLHIVGLAQITAAYGAGREMIVVGIEGVDRRHDLTSPSSQPGDLKRAPTSGGALNYRRFLVEELKPWVAARYRTDGKSALIGESLAGLFVLETLFAQPTSFSDFIAVSPSLWWNAGKLSRDAPALVRSTRFSGQRLWVAFDVPSPPESEAAKERTQQLALETAFRTTAPTGLTWTVVHSAQGHGSIFHPAALEAFRALYALDNRPK